MLCNLLTTILRPNFEEPLDTFKQLVEKNITLFMRPGTEIWKQLLLESPILGNRLLGETMIIADNEDSASKELTPTLHGGGRIPPPPQFLDSRTFNIDLRGPRFWYNSYFIVTI